MKPKAVLVLDIGKTNVKLVACAGGREVDEVTTPNRSLAGPPYLHFDVERLWS